MPRISIGDCQLYVERHGAGFPVLFISGLNGLAAYWRDQVPGFSAKFDVLLHDHRGVGQSDHSRVAYTVERMAEDVLRLMDALGIARAHVIGHSTGGAIAQVLAIEHPNRLASVVIAASWTKADAYFRRLFALRKDILIQDDIGGMLAILRKRCFESVDSACHGPGREIRHPGRVDKMYLGKLPHPGD